jgi:hypothetical protein
MAKEVGETLMVVRDIDVLNALEEILGRDAKISSEIKTPFIHDPFSRYPDQSVRNDDQTYLCGKLTIALRYVLGEKEFPQSWASMKCDDPRLLMVTASEQREYQAKLQKLADSARASAELRPLSRVVYAETGVGLLDLIAMRTITAPLVDSSEDTERRTAIVEELVASYYKSLGDLTSPSWSAFVSAVAQEYNVEIGKNDCLFMKKAKSNGSDGSAFDARAIINSVYRAGRTVEQAITGETERLIGVYLRGVQPTSQR